MWLTLAQSRVCLSLRPPGKQLLGTPLSSLRPPTLSIGSTFVTSKAVLDTIMELIGYLVDWNCTKLLVSV